MKIGIYSSPGPKTCAGYVGSYGHEEQDAKTWAAWGIDYLKYDWCSASRIYKEEEMHAVYQIMGDALEKRTQDRLQLVPVRQSGRVDLGPRGERKSVAHDRRYSRHVGVDDDIGLVRTIWPNGPLRDIGTIPTCWRSAMAG